MKTKERIKYFNPNEVQKNSRRGVNIWWKIYFTEKDIRLSMIQCNLYFNQINKKSA